VQNNLERSFNQDQSRVPAVLAHSVHVANDKLQQEYSNEGQANPSMKNVSFQDKDLVSYQPENLESAS